MKMRKRVILCLLATIAACATSELLAQFPGGGGFPGGTMRGGRNRPDSSMKDKRPAIQEDTADLVEYRLAMLQEDLKLSSGQENAWLSYADKVRALVSDISKERGRGQIASTQMDALQQVDHAVDVARNRLTALEDIASAAKTLYGGLTPQQKLLADSRFVTIIPLIIGGAPGISPDRVGQQRNAP